MHKTPCAKNCTGNCCVDVGRTINKKVAAETKHAILSKNIHSKPDKRLAGTEVYGETEIKPFCERRK